jgi:hypothetical protein
MDKAKRARTAETPKRPSLCLMLRAPYLYPDRAYSAADPSSGISSGDALIRPERHPACRRREARLGSGTERENLRCDAKGEVTSG